MTKASQVWEGSITGELVDSAEWSSYKIWTTHNKLNGQCHLPGMEAGCGSRPSVTGKEEKSAKCVTVVRDTASLEIHVFYPKIR